ncbi:MAG: hypothetical protein NT042_08825 [Sulfuritalea sp.]|nr:hypothetical protein [Sulfuritalea sp.]
MLMFDHQTLRCTQEGSEHHAGFLVEVSVCRLRAAKFDQLHGLLKYVCIGLAEYQYPCDFLFHRRYHSSPTEFGDGRLGRGVVGIHFCIERNALVPLGRLQDLEQAYGGGLGVLVGVLSEEYATHFLVDQFPRLVCQGLKALQGNRSNGQQQAEQDRKGKNQPRAD